MQPTQAPKQELHELEWKNSIWTQVCYYLSLSFFVFFFLKSYQQVANLFFISLEGFLALGLFFEFKNKNFKSARQLKNRTFVLLGVLYLDAILFAYYSPSYSLEKSYWFLVIPLIAVFFLGRKQGIGIMVFCFLTHLAFSLKYRGLPAEVLVLGKLNQLLILLICMGFFFNVAKYLQTEFQLVKKGLRENVSFLYSEWRRKTFEENIKNASSAISLLRHELNNPGAIISLSLQILKKDSNLSTITLELQAILLKMNEKIRGIESKMSADSGEMTVEGIEKEIAHLNQVSEEKWNYRFVLFAQFISAMTALSIATYAVVRFGPDWYRLLNAIFFGLVSLISAYWTFSSKNAKKSLWLFSLAVYIQLMAPILSQGGIFSNGIIWLAVAPYFFYLAMGSHATSGFRWVSALGLVAFFYFGHDDSLYVSNAVMRLVNFTFSLVMICGFGLFFERKRLQMVSALDGLAERYNLQNTDFSKFSDRDPSLDIISKVMIELAPEIQRAHVLAEELKLKCEDPLVAKISSAVFRMQRFSESAIK